MSPAQLSAVRALDVSPGCKVLDLCSSPGGKARVMISCLKGDGTLVCAEKSIVKIRKEKQDLVGGSPFDAACGPHPAALAQDPARRTDQRGSRLSAFFVCADAGHAGNMFPKEYFDRVMLDVPCSNSAEMSKRPEVRWRISPEDIKRLSLEQKRLLSSAAEAVKKGGVLVYSTCSLMQEENSSITGQFIKNTSEFTLEKEELFLPTAESPSGGYYARLVRATG